MVRVRKGFDRIKEAKLRDREAMAYARRINLELSEGWRPDKPSKADDVDLLEALRGMLAMKATFTRPRTMQTYQSRFKIFEQLVLMQWPEGVSCSSFGISEASKIMDLLVRSRNISGRTYNNYLTDFKGWFNDLIGRGYYKDSPFAGIKPVKEIEKQNRAFSSSELARLVEWTKANDIYYYMACGLCYYCALRPAEIVRLQREDLNLKQGFIDLAGSKAKNGRRRLIPIAEGFRRDLAELLANVPASYYVWGQGRQPSNVPTASTRISDHWRKVIRPALGFSEHLEFYGLKDTAAERLAAAGVDMAAIRDHFGHSSVAITDAYLKKRQGFVNSELARAFPDMTAGV